MDYFKIMLFSIGIAGICFFIGYRLGKVETEQKYTALKKQRRELKEEFKMHYSEDSYTNDYVETPLWNNDILRK